MREHKTIEGILKDQRGIYMAVKCSLGSSNQNKKNIIEFTKQKGKFKGKGRRRRRRRVRVMTSVAFVVKKKSHQKKECPQFLKRQSGMHHSLLVESCLVLDSTNSWWINFGVIDHVYNSLQGFQLRKRLNDGDMYLTLAFEARIVVQAMGCVTLILDDSYLLKLKDCLYVFESRKNLILVSNFCKQSLS